MTRRNKREKETIKRNGNDFVIETLGIIWSKTKESQRKSKRL